MKKSKLSLRDKSAPKFRTGSEVKEEQVLAAASTRDNRPAQILADSNTSSPSRSSGLNKNRSVSSETNGPDDCDSHNVYKIHCEWKPMPAFEFLFENKRKINEQKVRETKGCSLPSAITNPSNWLPLPKSCRKCMIKEFLKVKLIKCEGDENYKTISVVPADLGKIEIGENLTTGPSNSGHISGSEFASLKDKDKHLLPNFSGRSEKMHGNFMHTKKHLNDPAEIKQTTFKENASKVLPSNDPTKKRKQPPSSLPTLQASKRIRMEPSGASDSGNSSNGIISSLCGIISSSSGIINSSKGQTLDKELLTQCPMCRSEFDCRMTQMEIDQHIARCLFTADDDVVW